MPITTNNNDNNKNDKIKNYNMNSNNDHNSNDNNNDKNDNNKQQTTTNNKQPKDKTCSFEAMGKQEQVVSIYRKIYSDLVINSGSDHLESLQTLCNLVLTLSHSVVVVLCLGLMLFVGADLITSFVCLFVSLLLLSLLLFLFVVCWLFVVCC